MEGILYNDEELITKIYVVIWDKFQFKGAFRSKSDALEYIYNRIYQEMYEVQEVTLY